MFGKRFEHEQKLVADALQSEQGEKALRAYLKPMVMATIDEFLLEHPDTPLKREALMSVAWKYLSMAVRKYQERSEKMFEGSHDVFYFETYFRWFVRQAFVEHLDEND